MRLIMMGNGPFAVPTYEKLLTSPHSVELVVVRPARAGKGLKPVDSPMHQAASRHGSTIFQPENINTPEAIEALKRHESDLLVVADYGQILKPEVLAAARLGGINLHASLLPKYRGAAPINWAIYHGERETGVSVIHMTPRLDAGPTLAREVVPIEPADDAVSLEARLAKLGAEVVLKVIEDFAAGRESSLPQDHGQATKAPRLTKQDGIVDWSRGAEDIVNQVRALVPWPKTCTFWRRPAESVAKPSAAEPMRILLTRVRAIDENEAAGIESGTVVASGPEGIVVACGRGKLVIEALQPAGKREMPVAEFLRGYPLTAGQKLTHE